jgi:uncharacterized protein YjeT (DUF2065 family)
MNDLLAGLGIALVLEGLLWALAPGTARRLIAELSEMGESQLRAVAWTIVAGGCVLVWLARG